MLVVEVEPGCSDSASGPSEAWSEKSLTQEHKSEGTLEQDSSRALSAATSRRRRPAASEEGDNKSKISDSSSNASKPWITFPHDSLLAFGVSDFDGASQPSTRWSWDEDSGRNPNSESFVCEDEKEVLRHMTYLEGLCLRQEIRGPIGLKLSSELSHQNVPEFSTFWSSKPVTASLSKISIKVLLLVLAVGFTYLANLEIEGIEQYIYALRGNCSNFNPQFIAVHTMVLDVTTDPRDAALQARRPIRLSKTGVLAHPSFVYTNTNTRARALPFGFVHHLVSNYTVFNEDHHSIMFSKPIGYPIYWELQGRHPTRDHYFAFVWQVDVLQEEEGAGGGGSTTGAINTSTGGCVPGYKCTLEENSAQGVTSERFRMALADAMLELKKRFSEMSYMERLGNASTMLTCGFFDGQPLRIVYRRRFVKIEQGWDGKERSVTHTHTHSQTHTHPHTNTHSHTHTHTQVQARRERSGLFRFLLSRHCLECVAGLFQLAGGLQSGSEEEHRAHRRLLRTLLARAHCLRS
jgi:hypothetical protein